MLYGMVFSLLYNAMTQYSIIEDKSGSNLLGGRPAVVVCCVASICLASYSAFTSFCTNKPDCNEVHPYVAWVPVSLHDVGECESAALMQFNLYKARSFYPL